ncbi:hypothetical protein GE061_007367 [Apolygus lucorum]|uniref:Uncharacterized protein n=1 Tax=Apolygus lucorum TaxID=248454 RepID=A0A6A4J990_APOLU|nr:hypothetical protein GE061_007367 [Apolygus lucorum]
MPSRLRKKTNAKKDMKCRTKPSPSPPYTEEQMRAAVQQVLEGKPMAAAARDNCVPRTSLLYKAKGLRPLEKKMGPKTILTSHEEKFIENWVLSLSKDIPGNRRRKFFDFELFWFCEMLHLGTIDFSISALQVAVNELFQDDVILPVCSYFLHCFVYS